MMIRFRPLKARRPVTTAAVLLSLAAACAACSGASPGQSAASAAPAAAETGFAAPPQILTARRLVDGQLSLAGVAPANAAVRLASPGGPAFAVTADADGQWSMSIRGLPQPTLFGLSARDGDRTVQAEGYVAVLPPADNSVLGALLQAGAGAVVFGDPRPGTHIEAVDLDAARAAIVSGVAAPGGLTVAVDGAPAGDGLAGPDRHFSAVLARALGLGARTITVSSRAQAARLILTLGAPAPPGRLPYRTQRLASAWRIDWITPGGGLQTTYLPDRSGDGA